jgi:hypothetical protein
MAGTSAVFAHVWGERADNLGPPFDMVKSTSPFARLSLVSPRSLLAERLKNSACDYSEYHRDLSHFRLVWTQSRSCPRPTRNRP